MSGTNDTLNPQHYEHQRGGSFLHGPPAGPSLCRRNIKALKHDYLLKVSNTEDEIIKLEESQTVRLERFNADWDAYLERMQAEIARREKNLNADKAYLAARVADRKADLKALNKEHKEAKDILAATETLLRDSLSSITNALKALVKIKTRRKLSEYTFTPDTWLEDDED